MEYYKIIFVMVYLYKKEKTDQIKKKREKNKREK